MGDRINVKSGASSFLGFTRIYVLSLFFYKFRKPLAKSFVLFYKRKDCVWCAPYSIFSCAWTSIECVNKQNQRLVIWYFNI